MTIFYRGRCVWITHEVFEVRCPTHQSYALRDLSQLRVVEHETAYHPAIGTMRAGFTGVAGATAVAVALGWAGGWAAFESPVVAAATLALLIASAVVSGACWRRPPVQQELVALYRGAPVSLFRSPDATAFAQVKRGLVRALDRLPDTR